MNNLLPSFFVKKYNSLITIVFGDDFIAVTYILRDLRGYKLVDYLFKENIFPAQSKSETTLLVKNFVRKCNLNKHTGVFLSFAQTDAALIKRVKLPFLPEEEIIPALKWKFKDELSQDKEEVICDYNLIKEHVLEDKTDKQIDLNFVVANKKIFDFYLGVLKDCGLMPLRISISAFNFANLLKSLKHPESLSAVVNITNSETALYVYQGCQLLFPRVLPFSYKTFCKDLTGKLVSDKGTLEISSEEAIELASRIGIPLKGDEVFDKRVSALQIISLIRHTLESFVQEIQRSFEYLSFSEHEFFPAQIYLVGKGMQIKNLDKYLEKELKVSVSPLPLPAFFSFSKEKLPDFSNQESRLIDALGATVVEKPLVNLLPLEFKTRKIEFIETVSIRLISFTLALIFLLSLLGINFQYHDYQKRLNNASAHLQGMREFRLLKQKIDARDNLIGQLRKNHIPFSALLKILSVIIPEGVILNECIFNQDQAKFALYGTVVQTSMPVEEVLTEFMNEIEKTPFFQEASLLSSERVDNSWQFQIQCDFVKER